MKHDIIGDYPIFRQAIPDLKVSTKVLLTRSPLPLRGDRLACLIHAASVHPEPGSNSQINGSGSGKWETRKFSPLISHNTPPVLGTTKKFWIYFFVIHFTKSHNLIFIFQSSRFSDIHPVRKRQIYIMPSFVTTENIQLPQNKIYLFLTGLNQHIHLYQFYF